MKDENNKPSDMAITVVRIYRDSVLMPSLESDTSSDKESIPQTIEKKIKGIIINLSADRNRSDTTLKTLATIKLVMKPS